MAWIDFKKAYDSVTHECLQKSMKIVAISEKWIDSLTMEMLKWRTNIGSTEVRFERALFRGDSLAPLMFVIALCPMSRELKKLNTGYSMGRGKRKVDHLWFVDDCSSTLETIKT